MARAVTLAEERGLTPFCARQIPYSLVRRTVERELLPMARALDLAVTGWRRSAAGYLPVATALTAPHRKTAARPAAPSQSVTWRSQTRSTRSPRGAARAPARSRSRGCARSSGARQRSPIVGVRTEAQLADNLGAVEIDLEPAELQRLDEASRVTLGFPGDFGGASLAHGNTFDRVDDHRRTIDPLV